MRVETTHPETGDKIWVDISEDQFSELSSLTKDRASRRTLDSYIDNLDISADAKKILSAILDTSLKVGSTIIKIGQRIIELVLYIAKQFPNTTFGLILGIFLGLLVSSIPFIGAIFGTVLMPLAAAFGLASGYLQDIRDQSLMNKISEATSMFEPLRGQV